MKPAMRKRILKKALSHLDELTLPELKALSEQLDKANKIFKTMDQYKKIFLKDADTGPILMTIQDTVKAIQKEIKLRS